MKTKAFSFTLLIIICLAACSQFEENETDNNRHSQELRTKSSFDSHAGKVDESDVEAYLMYIKKIPLTEVNEILRYEIDSFDYAYCVKLRDGRWFLFSNDYSTAPVIAEGDNNDPCPFESNPEFGNEIIKEWLKSFYDATRNQTGEKGDASKNQSLWRHAQLAAETDTDSGRNPRNDQDYVYEYEYDTLSSTVYPALTQTKWHEGSPWNGGIPKLRYGSSRCYAGSQVVAISQLLYYTHFALNKPTEIKQSVNNTYYYDEYPYYDYGLSAGYVTTTWNYMPTTVSGNSTYNSYVAALFAYVAKLTNICYYVTDSNTTDPADSYTNFNNYQVTTTLQHFGLAATSGGVVYSKSTAMSEIQSNRPVLCYGTVNQSTSSAWKAYLYDGYRNYYIKETETISDADGNVLEVNINYYTSFSWHINSGVGAVSFYFWTSDAGYYSYNRKMFTGWH